MGHWFYQFLRNVGSFNAGVPGQGNLLGLNIGADEKAAPVVTSGVLQAAQDALGIDYNGDGKGVGFNSPSLLGIYNLPPYLHNGAAESIAGLMAHVPHRSAGVGFDPFTPERLREIELFVQSIDALHDLFVDLDISRQDNQVVLSFGTVPAAHYGIFATATPALPGWNALKTIVGTGRRVMDTEPITGEKRFFRVRETP